MCNSIIVEDPFSIRYAPDQLKTQHMCDKVVDDCLATLKFAPDWFVTSNIIKNFLLICTQMKIYSTLMKILVMSYLIVIEWVFLI